MNERLSAWMDGELESAQTHQLLARVERDVDFRRNWDCYHLIGDTLRGMPEPGLCARISARLDVEPTVLAPQRRRRTDKRVSFTSAAMAIAAAAAFVVGFTLPRPQENPPKIAAIPAIEVSPSPAPVGEGARGYLLAHQQFSPSDALLGVTGYVRSISQDRPVSGR